MDKLFALFVIAAVIVGIFKGIKIMFSIFIALTVTALFICAFFYALAQIL